MRLELFTDLTDDQLSELLERSERAQRQQAAQRARRDSDTRIPLSEHLRQAGINPHNTLNGEPRR